MSPGIEPIFIRLDRGDIALAKFLFESYEEVAIVRTLDRRTAVIVVLAVSDFAATAASIVDDLTRMIACEVVPPPPEAGSDWLLVALNAE